MEQDVLSDAVREFTILIKNNEDINMEGSDDSSDEDTSTDDKFKIAVQPIFYERLQAWSI